MSQPKATKIAFERRYADDSGVEFGVGYSGHPYPGRIEFKCVNEVDFPAEELDWLIDCLQRIRAEIAANPEAVGKP